MDNQQHLQTKKVSTHHQKGNKPIVLGSVIATLIAVSPYFFYLYESVPKQQVWDTFLFSYDSVSWGNANTAMWILTGKVIPLFFLLIWFFTCRHWWYHTLIVPISMYIYQTIALFNDDLSMVDEVHLIYLLPVMAIIIPSIYLLRAQMFNKLNDADKTMQELEDEFMLKPKGIWNKVKQYF